MENQSNVAEAPAEKTAAEKALENQLGVIRVVEHLFKAIDAGTFPLRVHDDVMAGMSFMAQFHKELVKQLPEDVRAKVEAANAPTA